ncbi:MAG: type II secretion system protein GspM [bacterium]|nr:type II secretion system protein GspM [bacterium]MDT8395748.1 type II secretion system protein GspM [bacterium]
MTDLLGRLSPRERWLVAGAAAFVGLAILYGFIIQPLVDSQRRYESMALRKQDEMARFRLITVQYRELESALQLLEKRALAGGSDGSLLALMESEAKKLGLADKIASMKPFTSELESGVVQSSVEMRVEKIDLKGLVDLLEALENRKQSAVTSRLRIKTRFDDPTLLDATVMVSTLEAR